MFYSEIFLINLHKIILNFTVNHENINIIKLLLINNPDTAGRDFYLPEFRFYYTF